MEVIQDSGVNLEDTMEEVDIEAEEAREDLDHSVMETAVD